MRNGKKEVEENGVGGGVGGGETLSQDKKFMGMFNI